MYLRLAELCKRMREGTITDDARNYVMTKLLPNRDVPTKLPNSNNRDSRSWQVQLRSLHSSIEPLPPSLPLRRLSHLHPHLIQSLVVGVARSQSMCPDSGFVRVPPPVPNLAARHRSDSVPCNFMFFVGGAGG